MEVSLAARQLLQFPPLPTVSNSPLATLPPFPTLSQPTLPSQQQPSLPKVAGVPPLPTTLPTLPTGLPSLPTMTTTGIPNLALPPLASIITAISSLPYFSPPPSTSSP
ncbi:hypothetical protein ACFE04_009942 [Oxalis oulophora]